jgi:hypothetical protein
MNRLTFNIRRENLFGMCLNSSIVKCILSYYRFTVIKTKTNKIHTYYKQYREMIRPYV